MEWMVELTRSPALVFICSFIAMASCAWIGAVFSRTRTWEAEAREEFGMVRTATLTLLGLLIGFSFSMALYRYDQRKNYEEGEANAIGTEYVRADLVPASDAAKIRALLLSYLDQRILFYSNHEEERLREINAQTARLQDELWSAVRGPALAQPSPVVALAVAGMNDVLNSQSYTQAAWLNRIPVGAWALMVGIALCANTLVGLGGRFTRGHLLVLLVMPIVVAITFFLIADIDSPRGGSIHVKPQNLRHLSESLRPR